MYLHTLEDRDAEALQERGWWSRIHSDSDRGRFRSKHRTTAPPRSTYVQPGDVSSFLIQQGERRVEGKLQQHGGVVAMELVVLRQGFVKHYGGGGGVGGGRGCTWGRGAAALSLPHYIRGKGGGGGALGFP